MYLLNYKGKWQCHLTFMEMNFIKATHICSVICAWRVSLEWKAANKSLISSRSHKYTTKCTTCVFDGTEEFNPSGARLPVFIRVHIVTCFTYGFIVFCIRKVSVPLNHLVYCCVPS